MLPKTKREKLLYFMPSDVKEVWDKLEQNVQENIIGASEFYILDSSWKVEQFWKTRRLDLYIKKVIKRIFSAEDPYGEENWD